MFPWQIARAGTRGRISGILHKGPLQGLTTKIYPRAPLQGRIPATRCEPPQREQNARIWYKDRLQGHITRIFSGPVLQGLMLKTNSDVPFPGSVTKIYYKDPLQGFFRVPYFGILLP